LLYQVGNYPALATQLSTIVNGYAEIQALGGNGTLPGNSTSLAASEATDRFLRVVTEMAENSTMPVDSDAVINTGL